MSSYKYLVTLYNTNGSKKKLCSMLVKDCLSLAHTRLAWQPCTVSVFGLAFFYAIAHSKLKKTAKLFCQIFVLLTLCKTDKMGSRE